MCGRLVNLDTVARVLAEYYHIKTDTQLVALNEALSKVPAVSVGGSHGKDHIADPGKMVGDLISRQAAIDALLGITAMRNTIPLDSAIFNIKKLPSAQRWIPCKERLPKDYESVNVTVRIPEGRYVKESAFLNGVWIGVSAPAEVVAWCPLPEPWKGEQE